MANIHVFIVLDDLLPLSHSDVILGTSKVFGKDQGAFGNSLERNPAENAEVRPAMALLASGVKRRQRQCPCPSPEFSR
jgi:hypothetical protein